MKKIRTTYPENSYEHIYADDVNFVSPSDIKLDEIEAIFRKWGLTLNKGKTKERLINEENTVWKTMKIPGSYVGTCGTSKKENSGNSSDEQIKPNLEEWDKYREKNKNL